MAGGSPLEQALVSLIEVSTELKPDDLGPAVVEAGRLLGGRAIAVVLVDLEQRVLQSIAGDDVRLPVEGSPAGDAFRSEACVVEDVDGAVRLWVPILDSAERVGVLGADVDDAEPETLRQWALLAGLVGELVVTKTRYGDHLAMARRSRRVSLAAELRWNILPPLTFTSADVVVSGMLEPAYEIAGDTFDYAINGDIAHVGLFDAMGHGLEACRMANLAVGAYQHGRRAGADLVTTVHDMDAVLAAEYGDSRFVTGQLATLRLSTGELTVISAGHPPPMVFHADGTTEDVPVHPSSPIGLGGGPRPTITVGLRSGDLLLFHTDGITEARSVSGEEFGVERLRVVVRTLLETRLRPAEVVRRVVLAVIAHGRPLRDDATLMFVGWRLGDRAAPPAVQDAQR